MINLLITKEHLNITILDPAIRYFTDEDVKMLSTIETELKISVRLEKREQAHIITLRGLADFIHTAERRIQVIILRVERNEHRKREATLNSRIVEWQYEQKKNDFKTFDILTNYDLEEAFNLQKPTVTVKIDNTVYDVDLVCKVATKGRKQIHLKRIDLEAQIPLPSHWEDMKGQPVVLVKLTSSLQEYADAEKEFRRTGLTSKIIQIERVQNSTLWKNYMIKKEELETKNNHKNNEKLLFHGTGPNNTDQINHHGFNRSYAGMHGALHGNGTYFAIDPKYSAQGYSPPDKKGQKGMYLARVLVGDFTQGKKGLPAPPKKGSNAIHLHDSVTDNTKKPSMFVIFHDVQAYPEYLITFQESN
ncbi:LOW QUALITY PROTEIN: protein mono-ADP-ribosyltransferase PARP14-like [Triplophysa rosa]|uniref:LOW QUALITY PROTEIN: protein mono-ADP-ribosyltransferase PARP14-like n=1 Tax=Triplophysa rosa TaxID=992332 RepID=UPI002546172A|nr:LOW QUALITY PROTEIN: protein mono-ADP-ribosyltransferase PARP14-like [Triplophysa rosa]